MQKHHRKLKSEDNNLQEINYDIDQEPIVISKITSDIILNRDPDKGIVQENPANLMALYWFYYYTAKWQKTNKAKATTSYVAKGLKWGEDKVRQTKKQLIELGLIEDVRGERGKNGKFGACYINVKFIWWNKERIDKFDDTHPRCFPQCGVSHSVENQEGNALSTDNLNALSTNTLNSLNNIYTLFLDKWNEQKIIVHEKITSKRKTTIDKVLKLKDYSKEEIFKAFQNYATALHSPDYFCSYRWTMEDFLQRGLHKFVDEANPLANKIKNNNLITASPSAEVFLSPTKESLNLFSDEAENLDDWIKIYSNLVNQWINADIWPNSYQPNKNKIHAALTELKNWVNNLIYGNYYSQIKRVAGSLETICEEYIEWIEEQDWLEEGIKEGSLFPSSEMFKNNFMPALEDKISDYPIRSAGWKNDSDIKMQTPDEIEEERKQNRINKKIMEKEIEQEKRDIDWAYECIERHFADMDLTNMRQIFNVKEFQLLGKQDGWQELFEGFIIDIEKKHQTNKGDRRFSYIYLFKNLKNIV